MELLFSILIQTTHDVRQISYFMLHIVIGSFVNSHYNLLPYCLVQFKLSAFLESLLTAWFQASVSVQMRPAHLWDVIQRRMIVCCRRFRTTYPIECGTDRLSRNVSKKIPFYAVRNPTGAKLCIYCLWGYSTILKTLQNSITLHAHFNLHYSHPTEVINKATWVMWDDSCPKHSGLEGRWYSRTTLTEYCRSTKAVDRLRTRCLRTLGECLCQIPVTRS